MTVLFSFNSKDLAIVQCGYHFGLSLSPSLYLLKQHPLWGPADCSAYVTVFVKQCPYNSSI